MKRVYLLRHAKAAPADAGEEDHGRVLLPRGLGDAGRLARRLSNKGHAPDIVLASSAARTLQTAELVLDALTPKPALEILDALYLAPLIRLLSIVHGATARAQSLMIVGHNPGLEDLASLLARGSRQAAAWDEKFPTCALAVLDFDIAHWGDVREGGGALVDFARPGDF